MSDLVYFEERRLGRWMPCTGPNLPPVIDGCQGPKIRAIAPVLQTFRHLTLAQLRELYSPDGRFYKSTLRGR